MIEHPLLSSLELHGIKLGLETITGLLHAAGDPHRAYPCVHVAGTNGKGSVVAMLDAMLRAAGYSTARFTSPHLIDLNERFLFNAIPITDAELEEELQFLNNLVATLPHKPTFFEACTAIAFRWFAQKKPDIALIEVGLGGRLDSTNVITPIACAITSIDYDHMRYLGNSLEKIAYEKAGILKPGVPCVVSEDKPGPLEVIDAWATEVGSPLSVVGSEFNVEVEGDPFAQQLHYWSNAVELERVPLALSGRHQAANAGTAIALAELLRENFPGLDKHAIEHGLANAHWPGRLERVLEDPPVFLDVAHNVAGAKTAAAAFDDCIAILAVSSDKNAAGMVDALAPVSRELILTQFQGPRATLLETLCQAAGAHPYTRAQTIADAIAIGMAKASQVCPLLITGSVFTVGEARQILVRDYSAPQITF